MIATDPPLPDDGLPDTIMPRLRASARQTPDHPAVVCGNVCLSWRAFDTKANRVANLLLSLGVQKGDPVAVLSPNSEIYATLFVGILRAGGCVTPLSPMMSPKTLSTVMRDCGAQVLFVAQAHRGLVDANLTGFVRHCIAIDFEDSAYLPLTTRLQAARAEDPLIPLNPDDRFNLIYSSGTTGAPKGILHTHAMRAAQMNRVRPNGYDDGARTLLSTPLDSNTTLVSFLPTLFGGSTVYLMPKFDARGFLEIVQSAEITHAMLVPVQYRRILDVPDFDAYDLGSLRWMFSTSAPLRADLKEEVLARFPGALIEYYGMTEGGSVCVLAAREHPDKLHTVGRPAHGCDLRLIDERGREVPQGRIGEVCGRSPSMMAGYFGRDDLTEASIWRNEKGKTYIRSGDLGRFDEDGFLILTDRKKDMIISGGLNIYADDLERALLADPDVVDAAVIGVPSQSWGETPLGLVVLRKGASRPEQEICDAANSLLGKAQRISAVVIRSELPRSSIGKVLKKDLRAPYWADATQTKTP